MSPHLAKRNVLDNVPPVGFTGTRSRHPLRPPAPQDIPLPACVSACLNYLGEGLGRRRFYMALPAVHPHYPGGIGEIDATFTHLMAATGAAFRLSWKPGWHGDNVATFLIGDKITDVFDRVFAWTGRKCIAVSKCDGKGEPEMRQAILGSIDAGVPVIAHGVIGPPEECVITGYDDGGDVLIGWNFFQDMPEFAFGVEFEPDGQFRKRRWAGDTWSLLLFGQKVPKLPPDEACRNTLRWAVEVIRTPRRQDRINGLAAFDAWQQHILSPDEFTTTDVPTLLHRLGVHLDATDVIAHGRWYAHNYCRLIADEQPAMSAHLWKAAACFDAQHTLVWELWRAQGGPGRSGEAARRFADPQVRQTCATIIAKARDLDARAADHIERALAH